MQRSRVQFIVAGASATALAIVVWAVAGMRMGMDDGLQAAGPGPLGRAESGGPTPDRSSLVAPASAPVTRSAPAAMARGEEAGEAPAGSLRTLDLHVFGRRSGLPIAGVDVVHSVLSLARGSFHRRSTTVRTDADGSASVQVEPRGTLRIRLAGHGRWTYDVPADVGDGDMTVLLNEHATLHGRVQIDGIADPERCTVLIRQAGPDAHVMRERRVAVSESGEWNAHGLELTGEHAFASGVDVSLRWPTGARPLASGLTIQPGDEREVFDPAESLSPWKIQFVYRDQVPLARGFRVLVMDGAGPDARPISEETTDEEGRVTLLGVGPGSWPIRIEEEGGSLLLGVSRAEGAPESRVVLEGVGRVAGSVVSASGTPLPGLHIQLEGSAQVTRAVLRGSKDGCFRFDLVDLDRRPKLHVSDLFGRYAAARGKTAGRTATLGSGREREVLVREALAAEVVAVPGFDDLTVRLDFDVETSGKPGLESGSVFTLEGWRLQTR